MHTHLLPEAVNYHLNKNCNFRCKGCYATFDENPSVRGAMLPRKEMLRIVEAISTSLIIATIGGLIALAGWLWLRLSVLRT